MTESELNSFLQNGENTWTEFKRCGNGIESDVYETVCAFANHFGGHIFCGVLDDGTIRGIPEKSVEDIKRNFITTVSNPQIFSPPLMLEPEIIKIQDKMIIHIFTPISSELHTFKKIIYDRNYESDIKVTSTNLIAEMYIRKQNIFTEKKIFKYVGISELEQNVIEKCRRLALLKNSEHPWKNMSNEEIIKSAHLYGKDWQTGEEGMTLAGILLLGQEDVIISTCPTYKTDAILRKKNLDRYDDRTIIYKNLVESYDILMNFAQKHLSDNFFMEGYQTVSLRDKVVREVVSNLLMHREFSSAFVSKFIIEKQRIYSENPCRAQNHFQITPEKFTPISKNPIIAHFFTNIGYADELGSGTRNLFKYSMLYSGKNPIMIEDTIFTTEVPLDENYSADFEISSIPSALQIEKANLSKRQNKILQLITQNSQISAAQMAVQLEISSRTVENELKKLRELKYIEHEGSKKDGRWIVK